MAITRIDIGGANENFQPRRFQWETAPTTDQHVVAHDFGPAEHVVPEDGPESA